MKLPWRRHSPAQAYEAIRIAASAVGNEASTPLNWGRGILGLEFRRADQRVVWSTVGPSHGVLVDAHTSVFFAIGKPTKSMREPLGTHSGIACFGTGKDVRRGTDDFTRSWLSSEAGGQWVADLRLQRGEHAEVRRRIVSFDFRARSPQDDASRGLRFIDSVALLPPRGDESIDDVATSAALTSALASFSRFVISDDAERGALIGTGPVAELEALADTVDPLFSEINAILDQLDGQPELSPAEEVLDGNLHALAQAAMEARIEVKERAGLGG